MDKKRTSFTLEKEIYTKIRLLAVKKDTTNSNIIREAIIKYLKQEENKNRIKKKIIEITLSCNLVCY